MKKATGIVLALMMLGVMMSGCYRPACDQPMPMSSYKDVK